ncbi:putative Extracellular membrane protein CFEM domain-containing protein [Seiridium cardinale]
MFLTLAEVASTAENSLCVAYPRESRTREVQIAAIVTLALSVPIVLARCAARLQTTKRLWLDDWTALLGMILLAGLAVIEYISSRMGFGMHYWNIGVDDGDVLLQLFYVAQLLYIMIQISAKISIACLFIRLFPARWIRLTLKIFITFMLGHGTIFIMVIIFQCWPIYSIWDKNVPGHCVDITIVGFVGAGISIVEDIILIILPVAELRKLQVTTRQRVVLFAIFAIASFAMVTSMIRLKYLVMFANTFDSTWDNVDVIIWSLIELLTAVFLGSLPPLRPWVNKIVPKITVIWSKPRTEKSGSELPPPDSNTETDGKSKHSRAGSLAVFESDATRFSNHTKTSSFAMSAMTSLRFSDQWNTIPESPLRIPTSRFQDSGVVPPESIHRRWSQQPDSPTDPNILEKSMSLYLSKVASHDLESNRSRDTWSTRDTWTHAATERLSSKFIDRRAGQ